MPQPILHIVIVNYRTAELVVNCLRSLVEQAQCLRCVDVTIVDSNSGDDSLEVLTRAIEEYDWSNWIVVRPQLVNAGFAYGNNTGIRSVLEGGSQRDLILLLNPDTVVADGALEHMINFMQEHPGAGIIGPRILNGDGVVQWTSHLRPTPWHEFDTASGFRILNRLFGIRGRSMPPSDAPQRCDWVSGACLMVRRQVVEEIGLMDDGYFLYFEEADFCCEAVNAGWQIWQVPKAVVTHFEGSSTGIRQMHKRRSPYWFESRRRFWLKQYGLVGLLTADTMFALGRLAGLGMHLLHHERAASPTPKWFTFDLLRGDLLALVTGKARLRRHRSLKG